MKSYVNKGKSSQRPIQKRSSSGKNLSSQFLDNRSKSIQLRQIQLLANQSPRTKGLTGSNSPIQMLTESNTGKVIQMVRWQWTTAGWKLLDASSTKKLPEAPKLTPGQKHMGMIYDTETQEWEKEEEKVEEEATEKKIPKGSKVKSQAGTFIGLPSGIHIHLVGSNSHLKMGGSGHRYNFEEGDKKSMQEAYDGLIHSGGGKPGFEACKEYFEANGINSE